MHGQCVQMCRNIACGQESDVANNADPARACIKQLSALKPVNTVDKGLTPQSAIPVLISNPV